MKKKKGHATKASTASTGNSNVSAVVTDRHTKEYAIQEQKGLNENEDSNQGFGDWLSSSEGVNYMKLFVLANSIVVFTTMSWPHLSLAFESLMSYFEEE